MHATTLVSVRTLTSFRSRQNCVFVLFLTPAVLHPSAFCTMPTEQQFWAVMECMDEYLAAQEQLSKALKDGLFNIARGKYTMGSELGQQRYPGDMQASSLVHACIPAGQDSIYDEFQLETHQTMQKRRSSASDATDTSSSKDSAMLPAATSQTKQVSKNSHSQCCSSDPVIWFRPLPPAPLRQAQSDFNAALQQAVAAVNAAQRLRQVAADLSDDAEISDARSGDS